MIILRSVLDYDALLCRCCSVMERVRAAAHRKGMFHMTCENCETWHPKYRPARWLADEQRVDTDADWPREADMVSALTGWFFVFVDEGSAPISLLCPDCAVLPDVLKLPRVAAIILAYTSASQPQ